MRSLSWTTVQSLARWPPSAARTLAVEDLPCPQMTATGFSRASIVTTMQNFCPREPPLPRLPVAVREVRVAREGLVYPDAVPGDDPGGLVRGAQGLRDALERHVEPHEAYEREPLRRAVPGVLEDRPGQRVVPGTEVEALPPLDPGGVRPSRFVCPDP